jgi:threonyl-tRNA synthetase
MTGMDRLPCVIGIGNEEIAFKKLTMTVRTPSQPGKPFREQMTVESLVASVRRETEGKPFRPLYTPRKLSMKAHYI